MILFAMIMPSLLMQTNLRVYKDCPFLVYKLQYAVGCFVTTPFRVLYHLSLSFVQLRREK